MKRYYILAIMSLAAAAAGANQIDDIVNRIVAASPQWRVGAATLSADSLAMRADNTLADPEISVESLFGKGDNKYNVGVSQSFDWPGAYKARDERNAAVLDAQRAELAASIAETRLEATNCVLDIIASRQRLETYSRVYTHLTSLLDKYTEHYAKGNVTILDVNKLRIEVAEYGQCIEDEKRSLADAQAALAAMAPTIDVEALTSGISEFAIEQLADIEQYREAMVANAPQVNEIRARRLVAQRDAKVAAMAAKPGFTVGYRYAYEDAISYNGFELGLSLPVWGNRARKAAAQGATLATDIEEEAAISTLNARLDSDYARAQSLKARIDGFGKALTTTDNIALLRRAFDAGQITLTELITDTRYFIEAQTRLTDLQLAYALTCASIAALTTPHQSY